MKKRILATVLGLALLLMAGAAAFAVDDSGSWDVRFTAENQLLSDYTLNGMAGRVFQMQPGDEVELTVNLSNANPDPANWYMTNKVLETLEAARAGTSGGAYDYELTYESPNYAEPLLLYSSERVGGENGLLGRAAVDRVGLEQATEGLEDWLYIDTIQPGAGGVVRLRVALDGETQGNAYQDTLARLQLNFAVDPVTSRNEVETVRRELRIVQTGDTNEALPFIILAGVSGLLLLAFGLFGLGEKKRAKKAAKQLTCMALALVLALTMPAALGLSALAADDGQAPPDDGGLRTYIVRLSPGMQTDTVKSGTVKVSDADTNTELYSGSAGVPVELTVAGGTRLEIQITNPEENGTKYYVRGIRESGEDNTTVDAANFEVDQDKDYVIAYGIKGQRVQYAIRFVDAEGNQLADEVIQWGNVGDRPVVACQYIDGYRPNAWNLTKTLVAEDEISANVFEFVYTPLGTTVTTEFIDGGVTVVGGGGGAGGGGGGAAAGPAAPAGPGGAVIPEEETPLAPPEEVMNLDEERTPLAGLMNDFASSLLGLSWPLRITLVGGVVALGSLIILAVTKKRKKKQDAQEG